MNWLLGSDYRSFLLEHIDEENLPTEYGGTCTCEGLGGCAFSSDGPWLEGRASFKNKPNLQQESDKVMTTVENDKEKVNGSMREAEAIAEVVWTSNLAFFVYLFGYQARFHSLSGKL